MMKSDEMMNRGFEMSQKSMAHFWDTWFKVLGSITWSQEQMDKLVLKYMEQKKVASDEAVKFVGELATQASKNQQQFEEVIKDTMTGTFQNVEIPNFFCMSELSKRVDELSKKVASM